MLVCLVFYLLFAKRFTITGGESDGEPCTEESGVDPGSLFPPN